MLAELIPVGNPYTGSWTKYVLMLPIDIMIQNECTRVRETVNKA